MTGASSGIGLATAEYLLDQGWCVALNSRGETDGLHEVLERHPRAFHIRGDVACDADCRTVVAAVLDRWCRIDGLVNNAGTTAFIDHADVDAVTGDVWRKILDVNVIGTWQMSTAALPALRESGAGAIVNMASVAGLRQVGSSLPYSVSKAAVVHMTGLLAKVVGPQVRVNAVAPGMIETPWTSDWAAARTLLNATAPLRRTGRPEEVAELVEFLLTAAYVTGETVSIDGGMKLVL
ncbi:SDR family NAD(P)-dependent oxidoreductase [Streptomyces sp. NPDC008343]|uniref:SDR family NAD(P)-dependent oxidoreductase n=1 Tax=Streptomyces sp. NPDC008343 TaxID=3364828 RepID=UPI0036EDF76C